MHETAAAEFPELTLVDELIAALESLIAESDENPFFIDSTQRPRKAAYRNPVAGNLSGRKPHSCEAVHLDDQRLTIHCHSTELVRQTPVEVTIQAGKSGHGETMATVTGKVREMRRVRGGYEIDVDIAETRKNRTTPGQKLRACLDRSDPAAWNRWVQDISGSLELMGMNLKHVDLSGYDLCCADFTGSDFTGANLGGAVLSGADLRKCVLDQVNVAGADLFRARLDRAHAPLVRLSGMPEVESVILSEE